MKNSEVTVQFNLNYNTDQKAPEAVTVPKDKEMALAQKPVPERAGYRFAGWYKDPGCTQEWLFGAKTPEFMKPPVEWITGMPNSTFISVDLPAPFSPSSAWISPGRMRSVTSLSTALEPYSLVIWFISSTNSFANSYNSFASPIPGG